MYNSTQAYPWRDIKIQSGRLTSTIVGIFSFFLFLFFSSFLLCVWKRVICLFERQEATSRHNFHLLMFPMGDSCLLKGNYHFVTFYHFSVLSSEIDSTLLTWETFIIYSKGTFGKNVLIEQSSEARQISVILIQIRLSKQYFGPQSAAHLVCLILVILPHSSQ